MEEQQRQHFEDLRQRHQRRLHELERQAATFGLSTPPEISIEIEDIRASIATIDTQLTTLSWATNATTIPRFQSNLPASVNRLIGREKQVATACSLLRQQHIRLLTLTGPGGTGKTRLGIQIATEMSEDFSNGVFFVGLASITNSTLVIPTLAQALGIPERSDIGWLDNLKQSLSERQTLLLLDNFEQVIDAAPFISELLITAPKLKMLVTSRIPLKLYGEHEFPVPPLQLPEPDQKVALDQLTQYEAVRLFIDRALAVKPTFSVTNENAPAIAEICSRLDGLPLAIELAAARVKFFSPQKLLSKLDKRIDTLVGTVNLIPDKGLSFADAKFTERSGTLMRADKGLRCQLHTRYGVPDREAFLEHHTIPFCAKTMTAGAKVLTNRTVGSQKTLRVAR